MTPALIALGIAKQFLTPVAICVVLPVLIVTIVTNARSRADNNRKEIIIKAIESNPGIETAQLIEAFGKPSTPSRPNLLNRLLLGCMFTLLGIVFAVSSAYFHFHMEYMNGGAVIGHLISSGVCFAIGISYLIVYFVGRRTNGVNKENNEHRD